MPSAVKVGSLTTGHESWPPQTVDAGSGDVNINGSPASRIGDPVSIHVSPSNSPPTGTHDGTIASGSGTVLVNGIGLARLGDDISCGGTIAKGSGNVFAGG